MIIKGKEIKPESITMWVNILGFLVGILFYFRLEHNAKHPETIPVQNPIHDSVLVLDTKLHDEVKLLKLTQDSLIKEIRLNTEFLKSQKKTITVIRHQLQASIQSDWDSLSPQEQNAYINQLTSHLKNKKQ